MEASATRIDLVNDDTEHNKAQGYRGGQGNLEQEYLVIDEDAETDEVVVITKATEEGNEDNAHNEIFFFYNFLFTFSVIHTSFL